MSLQTFLPSVSPISGTIYQRQRMPDEEGWKSISSPKIYHVNGALVSLLLFNWCREKIVWDSRSFQAVSISSNRDPTLCVGLRFYCRNIIDAIKLTLPIFASFHILREVGFRECHATRYFFLLVRWFYDKMKKSTILNGPAKGGLFVLKLCDTYIILPFGGEKKKMFSFFSSLTWNKKNISVKLGNWRKEKQAWIIYFDQECRETHLAAVVIDVL